jgi:hypothetical protein
MPRLSRETWADVRAEREAGASFPELAAKYGVSHQAIQKRAKAEGWGDGTDVAEVIRRKVAEKVARVVAGANPQKRAEAIDAEAEKRAAVVRMHQAEWDDHRARFGSVPEDFEAGKLAKISAEMLRIRQDGERKAWGLDTGQAQGDVVLHHNLRIVGDGE